MPHTRAQLQQPTTPPPDHRAPKNIVIVGGGIVGVCTAYFLAISPHRPPGSTITIVEGTGIASAASGYSGGFLARDWHSPATASESACPRRGPVAGGVLSTQWLCGHIAVYLFAPSLAPS